MILNKLYLRHMNLTTNLNNRKNGTSNNSGGTLVALFILIFIVFAGYALLDNIFNFSYSKSEKDNSSEERIEYFSSQRKTQKERDSITMINRQRQDSLIRIEQLAAAEKQRETDSIRRLEAITQKEQLKKELYPLVEDIAKQYHLLMEIKNTSVFRTYGFGRGGPYHAWLHNVDILLNHSRQYSLWEEFGFGVLSLKQLGLEYVESNGRETDFSNALRGRIIRLLKEFDLE